MAPTEDSQAPPPARRSLLRRVVFALAPLLILLVGAELLLRLFGVAEVPFRTLSRGFDPEARYLVRATDEASGAEIPDTWVTQIYDGLHPELVIGPKGVKRRVLLVGGSNVRRFADDYLQAQLNELAPPGDRGWEVLNLGREGYGSERVSILLRQALVTEPDVVVIYSGHNEFIERRFADEIDASMSLWEQRLTSLLSTLRLYRVVESAGGESPPPRDTTRTDDRTPEQWQLASTSYRTLPWAGTQRYLAAYRQNLARMIDDASAAGTQVVLGTLVSHDFSAPVQSKPPQVLARSDAAKLIELRDTLITEEPDSPWAGLKLTRQLRWPEWRNRPEAPAGYQAPQLRALSGRLAEMPATKGPLNSIPGAHWVDPQVWSGRVLQAVEAFARLVRRDLDPTWRAICEQHVERCERALEIHADDPDANYDLGLCLWLLGSDDARAARLLRRAAAFDRVPLAANATINAIVREVHAASEDRAALLDADELFRDRCPDGLIGFEVMMDHCHLQPGAAQVLLDDFTDLLLALEE